MPARSSGSNGLIAPDRSVSPASIAPTLAWLLHVMPTTWCRGTVRQLFAPDCNAVSFKTLRPIGGNERQSEFWSLRPVADKMRYGTRTISTRCQRKVNDVG